MTFTNRPTIQFDPSNMSAFGTLLVSDMTPSVQLDFVYNYVNTQTGVATTANSATVDGNGGRLRLQSGTNAAGSAIFNSRRIAKYRPGEGMLARFTAVFTTGVASSTQIAGVGNTVDGYFFGYNGATFGILHRNNSSDTWIAQSAWNGDKFKLGATANGSPAFAAINGTTADSGVTITSANSLASYDTAGTTLATQGTLVFNVQGANNGSNQVDLTPYDLYIAPGETMILTGTATVSSSLGVAVNWSEDI